MRSSVVLFPGINADAEMIRTLKDVCGAEVSVVRHTDTVLPERTDLVAIPGGFSYGDYLRCGAIAKVAPIVPALSAHAQRGGFVIGVCNGFQILTEIGLLPGALTRNVGMRFLCGDVFVKVRGVGPFTPESGVVWRLPVAHGEGRYQASPDVLARLHGEGDVALVYSSARGEVTGDVNLNGSVDNIAGIYGGPRKNVFGLMPHPERMSELLLGGTDGRLPFDAVFRAAASAA